MAYERVTSGEISFVVVRELVDQKTTCLVEKIRRKFTLDLKCRGNFDVGSKYFFDTEGKVIGENSEFIFSQLLERLSAKIESVRVGSFSHSSLFGSINLKEV